MLRFPHTYYEGIGWRCHSQPVAEIPPARLGVLNAQCYAMFRPDFGPHLPCSLSLWTAIRIPRRIVTGDSGFAVDLVRCKRHVRFFFARFLLDSSVESVLDQFMFYFRTCSGDFPFWRASFRFLELCQLVVGFS